MSIRQTDSDSGLLRLDNQLCFLLYSASRRMTSVYRPLLNKLGITYPQYLVMLVLWEDVQEGSCSGGGVRVGELSAKLHLDSGTLTPLLKRMEQQGLLIRSRDEADERVVKVRLTEKGAGLREDALKIPKQIICESGLNVEDFIQIHGELSELIGKLPGAN